MAVFSISFFSCSNKKRESCYTTSEQAFNAMKEAIYLKDFQALKNLTAITEWKYIDYDSILNQYHIPSIDLIPETSDGAYGIKKLNNTELFYTSFNEDGILKEIKVIEFQNHNGCYKIVNIADVKKEDSTPKEKKEVKEVKEVKKAKQYAKITTIADGYDVKRVNLWSSSTSNRTQVGFCTNNEKVEILEYSGEYVKIRKTDGIEGWCMSEFLK